jgi:hypothetical protein
MPQPVITAGGSIAHPLPIVQLITTRRRGAVLFRSLQAKPSQAKQERICGGNAWTRLFAFMAALGSTTQGKSNLLRDLFCSLAGSAASRWVSGGFCYLTPAVVVSKEGL